MSPPMIDHGTNVSGIKQHKEKNIHTVWVSGFKSLFYERVVFFAKYFGGMGIDIGSIFFLEFEIGTIVTRFTVNHLVCFKYSKHNLTIC